MVGKLIVGDTIKTQDPLIKVLMLGWEFPPIMSGGLGVATYGMVKALRTRAHVKLIIPASDPSMTLENTTIIGLNNLTLKELSSENVKYSLSGLITEVESIPLTVSPYHHINLEISRKKKVDTDKEETLTIERTAEKINQVFSSPEIYGSNIIHKVHLFAALADKITSSSDDFDIIHAHDWVTYPAALKIKEHTGKPLVLHVHALETDRSGEAARNQIYWLEKNAFEKADHILAVSQFTKSEIIKHYDIDSSVIDVVYNGIEPKPVTRKKHKLKDKIVVFLGRITHQKGPRFLLETAEKVANAYTRVKFVVAGTGDQFAQLLESTAFKKLGKKFIFTGFLSKQKVDELLEMADVYFMPSVSEPFGLTALEAAQHFVPGVLSRQSGAGEVITASLQADYWDTDKYANYIYALLKYDTLHKAISNKANEELRSLTWEHAADKIIEQYKKLVDRGATDN